MPRSVAARRSWLRLWLMVAIAYTVARLATDRINFDRILLSADLCAEIVFIASAQTFIYRLIARR